MGTPAANKQPRSVLLAICYLGFVSLGLPDTLIGVAWPSIRDTFKLQQNQISWIFFGSGLSYFVSSFYAGRLLKIFNVGVLLAGSSGLVALAMFNYGFATVWTWFAVGALLHGLGSGAIDSGLNHYVATHFSARHMNWLHACYSLGAMIGPVIVTACLARPAAGWRLAYVIVASTLAALALLFLMTKRQWADDGLTEPSESKPAATTACATLKHPIVQLHILLFFFYTGLEVAVGQWSFTVLTESRGVSTANAGAWVTIYWAGILAGRVGFGFIVERFGIDLLIRHSLALALAGTALFVTNPFAQAAPIALALCGLGLAAIFPCLITRTPQRLGVGLAAHAIGFQVGAAMIGAAALPSLCGLIARYHGLQFIPITLFAIAAVIFLLHEFVLAVTGGREQPLSSTSGM